jgi:aminoglycoside phosphotransferase (APT) family kinase protein
VLDTLVLLHSVDARRPPVSEIGRPAGFLERQLTGWFGRWRNARTSEIPDMDRIMEWLSAGAPDSSDVVLLHNDYKLDNLMLDESNPARVVAVLDWEMAALGDPLIDLGILLCYMREDGETGWPTREELIERYAAATGRDASRIDYYEVFAMFKVAVVLQQIFHRYHVGQTHDSRFAALEQRVAGLIKAAAELI